MPTYPKLELDTAYHIYNRGNNREILFRAAGDYFAFLAQCHQRLATIADLFAYCLLGNHFHFALKTFSEDQQRLAWERGRQLDPPRSAQPFSLVEPSLRLANGFSSYAQRFNRRYHRTGALFERPFERRIVGGDDYLRRLIVYIHRNPQTHGLIDDFRNWPYSSYHDFFLPYPNPAQAFILDLFGGIGEFCAAHLKEVEAPWFISKAAPFATAEKGGADAFL